MVVRINIVIEGDFSLGTSPNAVLMQIWAAMCMYLLLAYIKFLSTIDEVRPVPLIRPTGSTAF